MRDTSKYLVILTIVLLALSLALPVFAAEGVRPNVEPAPALDDWDDDVWSDWGAEPATKGGNSKFGTDDLPPNDLDTNKPNLAGPAGDDAMGAPKGTVRFRLVREGETDDPKGVRKYRPTYGRRKSL
jgi:hypothetical protein